VLPRAERLLALEDDGGYLEWLEARCVALHGTRIPFVAAHHDLTTWNVLVSREGIGVVDWEAASEHAPPLTDLFYLLGDATAAADPRLSRADAVRRTFAGRGPEAAIALVVERRFQAALGIESPVRELLFHLCWLHHAANEADRGSGGEPFMQVVRWLCGRPRR
jgi:thiamine kinase-like enzyme